MMLRKPGLRQSLLTLVGLCLTGVAAWHAYYSNDPHRGIPVLHSLERYAYDLRLRASIEPGLDPRIVIVDIDEESLRQLGQWPWPRAQLAQLVDRLFSVYGVDTIGFDIVFSEPESSYPIELIEQVIERPGNFTASELKQTLANYQGDNLLAGVLNEKTILGYFFENRGDVESVGVLPEPVFSDPDIVNETIAPTVRRYSGSLPILQKASTQAGFFSLSGVTDVDGIIRRVALLNQFEGKLYGALPLIIARQYLGSDIKPLMADFKGADYTKLEGLSIGLGNISIDSLAAVFVPYHSEEGAYLSVPAWKILQDEVKQKDAASLAETIVLVGTSAAGLRDVRNTPLANGFPGVEIHANVLSGLLDGAFRRQPVWMINLDIVLIVLVGGLLSLLLPVLSIAKSSMLTAAVFIVAVLGNMVAWFNAMWVLPIATLSVLIWLLYSLNTLVGFFAESRSRQIMRRMFGLYIPSEIVDEMSATPDVYSLKSERREMSVLFSDVRDFTSISERLSPEALSELLNTLLTPLTEIIHRHQGAIDKYMGDAVMAFWGAPLITQQHASLAVSAALEMVESLQQINRDFAARNWPVLQMGIGISSGEMSVGNMGSEFRMAYTVLGDSVNLGSRLEGLTKLYGVEIIVSEKTRLAAPEFIYQALDIVRVKGKQLAEPIYTPIGRKGSLSESQQTWLKQFDAALKLYQAQHWDEALLAFESLQQLNKGNILPAIYQQRILAFKVSPPATDWDGVTTLSEK